MKKAVIIGSILIGLTACSKPNSKHTYGETGLPKNCRAIVQNAINEWRKGNYSTNDTMDSLERNCGEKGYSWEYD